LVLVKISTGQRNIYVRPYSQSFNALAKTGNNNTAITYGRTGIPYNGAVYAFCPIAFDYVNDNTFKITFNTPTLLNKPSVNGWINSLGFTAEIISGGYSTGFIGSHCGAEFDTYNVILPTI
jgi:hypothetical protein